MFSPVPFPLPLPSVLSLTPSMGPDPAPDPPTVPSQLPKPPSRGKRSRLNDERVGEPCLERARCCFSASRPLICGSVGVRGGGVGGTRSSRFDDRRRRASDAGSRAKSSLLLFGDDIDMVFNRGSGCSCSVGGCDIVCVTTWASHMMPLLFQYYPDLLSSFLVVALIASRR